MTNHPLHKWIPYRWISKNPQNCDWIFMGDTPITKPFFRESIGDFFQNTDPRNKHHLRSSSSLRCLPDWAEGLDAVAPSVIIFHVSRCGSTLACQLLATVERHIVLSEVPLFDDLLRHQHLIDAPLNDLLPAAIRLYGQKRTGKETHLFIKTDSWDIFFRKELRALYPETPFVLLYRRPDEVVRSQRKMKGTHAVPGLLDPAFFGFRPDEIFNKSPDEYVADVLEVYYSHFLDTILSDDHSYLINYQEGPLELVTRIAALAGTTFTSDEFAIVRERARFHSKYPGEVFAEPQIDADYPGYLEPAFRLYRELENHRLKQKTGKDDPTGVK